MKQTIYIVLKADETGCWGIDKVFANKQDAYQYGQTLSTAFCDIIEKELH